MQPTSRPAHPGQATEPKDRQVQSSPDRENARKSKRDTMKDDPSTATAEQRKRAQIDESGAPI